jgi:Arc/MetJ-type ribon-helix-helix transcriptional regulator
MPFAMFREVSEFVREALRFYVEKLEDNYKLELQEAKEHG